MTRKERLEMRLTAEEKDLLQRAAAEAGVEAGAWVRMVATKEARKVLGERKS